MSNIINFAADFDCYRGWAEAVCYGSFSQTIERRYNSAMVFKRARGQGQIREIRGMHRWLRTYGEHVVHVEMLPVGAHRRNWKATLLSDGHVMVRHPDLQATLAICDALAKVGGPDSILPLRKLEATQAGLLSERAAAAADAILRRTELPTARE